MDYSESIIYIRTFTRRCEEAITKKDLDKALQDAEHVVAEAIQLRSTIMKMKEYA
jgi:ribosomal protein S20